MPDLNFDNPKVRKEIYDIGKYWLNEIGVDGFRLDAAKHIFPDERIKDSYLFWQEYKREMQKVKDDVYLVGEVWAPASVGKEFAKGLPALFNFDLAGSIQQSILQERNIASTISGPSWENLDKEDIISRLIKQRKLYKDASNDYKDAIFLTNHDQNRIMSNLNGDLKKAKLAASILLTLAGTPYIYYGEEIGMLGKKPDPNIREPFLWDTKELDTFRTNWIEAVFTKDGKVQSLREQKDNPLSLYHHYRNLIHFRNQYIALSKGNIESIENSNPYLVVYRRVYQNEVLNVVHNLSSQSQLLDTITKEIIYGGNSIINNTINPFSTIIYK
jgi:glycosidase